MSVRGPTCYHAYDDVSFFHAQDIYLEEERHQHALMALDSSVLGCGSDDWSVDGDYYAFQDFPDDVHKAREHQRSASNPDRVLRRDGRGASADRGRGSRALTIRTGSCIEGEEKAELHVHVDSESGGAGPGAEEEAILPSELQALVITTEGSAGPEQEEHHPGVSDTRLLRDPGSSTDSTQILRLEQRMFLKVTSSSFNINFERLHTRYCMPWQYSSDKPKSNNS